MKKLIVLAVAFAGMGMAATFTGVITDDMCKDANHKDMKMGTDAKCVAGCIKGMSGKYVLYDGKKTYALSDQKTPAQFAAMKVTVTGTLEPTTQSIKVEKIVAAK